MSLEFDDPSPPAPKKDLPKPASAPQPAPANSSAPKPLFIATYRKPKRSAHPQLFPFLVGLFVFGSISFVLSSFVTAASKQEWDPAAGRMRPAILVHSPVNNVHTQCMERAKELGFSKDAAEEECVSWNRH